MRLSLAHFILIVCIPLAAGVGYWLGISGQKEIIESEVIDTTQAVPPASSNAVIESPTTTTRATKNSKTIPNKPAAKLDTHKVDDQLLDVNGVEEDSLEAIQEQAKEFNYPLASPDKDHIDERKNFIRNFSEEDEDWQAKTHFTDFLQLHDDAHLIDLHKIICSTEKCQLIGKYDAEHENWGVIVKEMQQQDWWTYWGTSSSTTTRDGVTYFNLFVNKPE